MSRGKINKNKNYNILIMNMKEIKIYFHIYVCSVVTAVE